MTEFLHQLGIYNIPPAIVMTVLGIILFAALEELYKVGEMLFGSKKGD